jgi:hypothetical protein
MMLDEVHRKQQTATNLYYRDAMRDECTGLVENLDSRWGFM